MPAHAMRLHEWGTQNDFVGGPPANFDELTGSPICFVRVRFKCTRSLLKNYCKTCFGYKSGDALGSPDDYKSILGHSGAKCFSASGHQTPFSTNS
jgi:hypothetical protein